MSAYAVVIAAFCLNIWPDGVSGSDAHQLVRRQVMESAVNVTVLACSGVARLHNENGFIVSPNYRRPSTYPSNSSCTWIIQAPAGKVVKLTVQTLGMEKTKWCRGDRLVVFDYNSRRRGRLTKLCGTASMGSDPTRATIYSRTNGVIIRFLTGATGKLSGFKLKYTFVDAYPGCYNGKAVRLTARSGKINSPYPELGFYPNSCRCKWLIVAPKRHTIVLTVIQFYIQVASRGKCRYDRVQLRNGGFRGRLLTPTMCGWQRRRDVRSTSRVATVSFFSNGAGVKTGFHIAWRFKKNGKIVGDVATCPGPQPVHLNASSGYIDSPTVKNSGLYSNGLKCRWLIQVPDGQKVVMNFPRFSLEEQAYGVTALLEGRCPYDAVDIYDGNQTVPSAWLATFCGSHLPGAVTSTGNQVLVVFRSDIALPAPGFTLQYRAVSPPGTDVCGVPQITPMSRRIVGGTEALPHSWPWQADLHRIIGGVGTHTCGGSIIHRRWIITAAHCIPGSRVRGLEVYVGGHNTHKRLREKKVAAKRVIIHKEFDLHADKNDIALIELKTNLTFDSAVAPVCLAVNDVDDGTLCTATGWGFTIGTGMSQILQQVNLPILPNPTCKQWFKQSLNVTINLCAGYKMGGMDTCGGDSGGPLVCKQDGVWRLHGITSTGDGCAQPEHPGIYVRVSAYLDWIQTHTGGDVTATG